MTWKLLDIKEVKEYLESERDKALNELKDDKNNVESHSHFSYFIRNTWMDRHKRERRT